MDFLIIGGDAAGMSAASRAKRHQPDMNVTVLEQSGDVSYSACGMPYNIADPKREIDDLVVRKAETFRQKQGINLLTGHSAEAIDPAERVVTGTTSDGKSFAFSYDKLLIATGATPIMPRIPGIDLPGVKPLKRLEDGRRFKSYLDEHDVKEVVIVGMGYIGLEMCEALRERGIDVTMASLAFMPGYSESVADVVRRTVTANGVKLHDGYRVEKIEQQNEKLQVTAADLSLPADLVLMSIGIRPNSAIAVTAGLRLGPKDEIVVDRYLKTSDENIYSAGDCADAVHLVTGGRTWIPLALRANRAGWAVADNVCGNATIVDGVVGTAVFKVFDLQVARTGLNVEEAKQAGFSPVETVIESSSRAHSHPGASTITVSMVGDSRSGRLLGVQMVGKEGVAHRINAPAVALHNQMTVEKYAQCDLSYAPPFGPVWDPTLVAANRLLKQM